jgi:hypothetical protein
MGLLDDAIREHLELKRRHGADLGDIERQEREALGEARRGAFAPTPDAEGPPAAPFDAAAEEPVGEVPEAAEPPELDERVIESSDEAEEASAAGYDEDPWLEEERDEVPSEEALDRPEAEGEDGLEETPEFLQETPEHDRLWFEQRPPRDFDWDK